jgi:hypothetical protein
MLFFNRQDDASRTRLEVNAVRAKVEKEGPGISQAFPQEQQLHAILVLI